MAVSSPSGVTIAASTHDLIRKRSTVTLIWDAGPDKSVTLPVSFRCSLDDLRNEAEKALRELSAEIATTLPDGGVIAPRAGISQPLA